MHSASIGDRPAPSGEGCLVGHCASVRRAFSQEARCISMGTVASVPGLIMLLWAGAAPALLAFAADVGPEP
jgi:hypothetical protein